MLAVTINTTTSNTTINACIVFLVNLLVGYSVDLMKTLADNYQMSEQKLSGWFRLKSGIYRTSLVHLVCIDACALQYWMSQLIFSSSCLGAISFGLVAIMN